MTLKYDPYETFRGSKTPAGLYARQKWLDEGGTKQWRKNFEETVASLLNNQLADGSWRESIDATIDQLFSLHLTLRWREAAIDKALNWLLEKINLQEDFPISSTSEKLTGKPLAGLPFVTSRPDLLTAAATLFLSSIFGRANERKVLANYQWFAEKLIKNNGCFVDRFVTHNILRALVVHPEFKSSDATMLVVDQIDAFQTGTGHWNGKIPFYQTLNALAHLEIHSAERQLERAFEWLCQHQNSDGTWSGEEPEWNTFLAVHALKSKNML